MSLLTLLIRLRRPKQIYFGNVNDVGRVIKDKEVRHVTERAVPSVREAQIVDKGVLVPGWIAKQP
jgi:hypothetical protein